MSALHGDLEALSWGWKDDDEFVLAWAADFETTTTADDCRVWAWAVSQVGDDGNVETGICIETFIEWLSRHCGDKVYFHNLKFDGKFIVSWLEASGWLWIADDGEAWEGRYETLISDMNQWYQLKLWFSDTESVVMQDSLKVIPLPVEAVPRAFGLDIGKLELDYETYREPGHELTDGEREYVLHDVRIMAKALGIMHSQGMDKMTAGSNAYADYKGTLGGDKAFRRLYPEPGYDAALREGGCYKGGFTAVNPLFEGKEVGEGISFDVNSLYPSVMACVHGEQLPYGEPLAYEGCYVPDPDYPAYIQFLSIDFTVKPDHIPSIQLKGSSRFGDTEYVRDSDGMVSTCLTSVDLELLFEQYDVNDVEYLYGFKFRTSQELFTEYVAKWAGIKTQASLDGNVGMRTIAKLQLNSLYGKLASNPVKQSRRPMLNPETGIVEYPLLPEEQVEAQYLPAAAFITSYARAFTIRASQANYARWLYSDTDSCYLVGTEPPEGIVEDPVELGAWKREHEFTRFKALRAKTYVFEEGGGLHVTCAGMPSRCHSGVTFGNFEEGSRFRGKLKPMDVKGGTILVDDYFTIKSKGGK